MLLDEGQQGVFELQRDVGILGSILCHALDGNQIHRQLLCSATDKGLDFDGLVIQIAQGKLIHAMARFGVEQVVENHRVELATCDFDAQTAQNHYIELYVLPDFCNLLTLKERAQNRGVLLVV